MAKLSQQQCDKLKNVLLISILTSQTKHSTMSNFK